MQGQEVFRSLCAACHILNGEGTTIGPDLTGAARDNLEYLLDNILFPNAVVPNEYRLSTLTLKDGRLLSGVIRSRTEKTLKLQSATEISALESSEIASEETSSLSLMPEGLLETLDETQARNLMAYLMSKEAPSK